MKKVSKRYDDAAKNLSAKSSYDLIQALAVIKENAKVKFDPSINVVFVLKIDSNKADQLVKGNFLLPHPTGKKKKVLLLVADEELSSFQTTSADLVGGSEIISKIKNKNFLDYDVVIASKSIARNLKDLARILGPRGLMPTLKNNTLVESKDIVATLHEIAKGKVNFKNDKQGLVHGMIGKLSSKNSEVIANFNAYLSAIKNSRPPVIKGHFISNIYLNATMCPAIKINF